jgi:HCOMODA/2-hydroxy-3-carboxy-muconic semialdehyde decarboxylase
MSVVADLDRRVRVAARAIARHGLAHAYGHCSERIDAESFLVCAPKPMGLIATTDVGTTVSIRGSLPDHVLGEVRLHQQIYLQRADVRAVIRAQPPACMVLSTAAVSPHPRHGPGTYFDNQVVHWDDVQLIRSDELASAAVQKLGAKTALFMRGNGIVVAATSLLEALVLTWYLEDAAKLELAVRSGAVAHQSKVISREECARRATRAGRIFERMAEYLCAGDPEGLLE